MIFKAVGVSVKIFSPIVTLFVLVVMVVNRSQSSNAYDPISVTLDGVLTVLMYAKSYPFYLSVLNKSAGIVFTFEPNVTVIPDVPDPAPVKTPTPRASSYLQIGGTVAFFAL